MIDRKFSTVAGVDPPLPGPWTSLMSPRVSSFLGLINKFLEWFGDLGIFFWRVVRAAVTPPFEFRELFRQLDEIGSKSLPLVALAGAATGVVLSLEARYSLTRFGAKVAASRRDRVLRYPRDRSDHHRSGSEWPSGRWHWRGVGVDESDRADRCHRGIRGKPL